MRGDRHMATKRSHNKPKIGQKRTRGLTQPQRAERVHNIGNRGPDSLPLLDTPESESEVKGSPVLQACPACLTDEQPERPSLACGHCGRLWMLTATTQTFYPPALPDTMRMPLLDTPPTNELENLQGPADGASGGNVTEQIPQSIGTLQAEVLALQTESERLKAQAREVSVALSDAGIGPCTIPEGVRQLVAEVLALREQQKAAETIIAALIPAFMEWDADERVMMPSGEMLNALHDLKDLWLTRRTSIPT